jgi:type IV pilus biogenesis protein PilP
MPLPLSNQQMTLDPNHVDGSIKKVTDQADSRVKDLTLKPSSGLTPPDVTPYKGELEEMAEAQRQIRILELKQKQADLAVKLWNTVYDGKREELAGRTPLGGEAPSAQPSPSASSSAAAAAANAAVGSPSPNLAPAPAPSVAAPAPSAAPPVDAGAVEAPAKKVAPPINPNDPLPRVSAVYGSGAKLTATILIPYMGELSVNEGAELPNGMVVDSISPKGVVVRDTYDRKLPLSFGSSVPQFQTGKPGANANAAAMGPGGGVMF